MRRRSQSGYFLLVLLLMVALMMLAVMTVAPRLAQQVKRDREIEMIHRGAQYARAIKRFYRKFGRYPTSIDQLKNTNNIRFLRQEYADPMSEDGKWKLLHPGDVKIGGANVGTPVSALAAGSPQPGGLAGTNPAAKPVTGVGPGARTSATTATATTTTTTTAFGSANSQIGGFIIGVASTSQAEGIHEFDNKSHYNEWYFVYDPTTDRGGLIIGPYTGKTFGNASAIPGATPAGQPGFGQPITPGGIGQPANPGFGQPGPIGTPPAQPKQ